MGIHEDYESNKSDEYVDPLYWGLGRSNWMLSSQNQFKKPFLSGIEYL